MTTTPLWTLDELARACGGTIEGSSAGAVDGVSIDSRSLSPGDLFVPLTDQRDGHEFVSKAFVRGAAAALVRADYRRQPDDGVLIRVADPLAALADIGRAARARLAPEARVIAVTGSVGKTGTKEMLRAALARLGRTHAADKSFNNHWGVPLTLARMGRDTRFGVFEIGMNHAGEITPLARMVRPHAAIITTVEPVHLAQFPSVEAIADAKAEIFEGLGPGGVAILNIDNRHYARLAARASARGLLVVPFGRDPDAEVALVEFELGADGSELGVRAGPKRVDYRLGIPGAHIAQNSLAVVAALTALGLDTGPALEALAGLSPTDGRGARIALAVEGGEALLIDESYNANPASMRASLIGLTNIPRGRFRRRIAVLGDMLELGADSEALHAGLKEAVDAAGADLVFASGPHMARLYQGLAADRQGAWSETSAGIREPLLDVVQAGDVIMIKGSLGSRMGPLVEALRARFGSATPAA